MSWGLAGTTVENTFRSPNVNYSVPGSYLVMQVVLTKLKEVDLVWSSVMLPIQSVIVCLAYQDKLLTEKRLHKLHIQF